MTTPEEEISPKLKEDKVLAAGYYARALTMLRQSDFDGAEAALAASIKAHHSNKATSLLKRIQAQTAAAKDRAVPPFRVVPPAMHRSRGIMGAGDRSPFAVSCLCLACFRIEK